MTEITKDREQLIAEVATMHGALTPYTVLSAEDHDAIDGRIDALIAQLAADTIIALDPDEIPTAYFLPVARLLANVCGSSFGTPFDQSMKDAEEASLTRLTRQHPTYAVAEGQYF